MTRELTKRSSGEVSCDGCGAKIPAGAEYRSVEDDTASVALCDANPMCRTIFSGMGPDGPSLAELMDDVPTETKGQRDARAEGGGDEEGGGEGPPLGDGSLRRSR